MFGTLRGGFLRMVLGSSSEARSLSRRLQDAWISFARDGSPEARGLPPWAVSSSGMSRSMILGPSCGVQEDVHSMASGFFGPLLRRPPADPGHSGLVGIN